MRELLAQPHEVLKLDFTPLVTFILLALPHQNLTPIDHGGVLVIFPDHALTGLLTKLAYNCLP